MKGKVGELHAKNTIKWKLKVKLWAKHGDNKKAVEKYVRPNGCMSKQVY